MKIEKRFKWEPKYYDDCGTYLELSLSLTIDGRAHWITVCTLYQGKHRNDKWQMIGLLNELSASAKWETLKEAQAYCEEIARGVFKNFNKYFKKGKRYVNKR